MSPAKKEQESRNSLLLKVKILRDKVKIEIGGGHVENLTTMCL